LEGCQLHCRFCHHEGNAAAKLVNVDEAVQAALTLRHELGLDKVHLTGGEPTLYPRLFDLIDKLSAHGFRIAITSHGLFSQEVFQHLHCLLKQGNLSYINLSIHTLRPIQYLTINCTTQNDKTYYRAEKDLSIIMDHAVAFSEVGKVNINCVVNKDRDSLEEMFEFACQYKIDLRLVPDWTALRAAHDTISTFLSRHQAGFTKFVVVHPTSNYSAQYVIDGVELSVKLIRAVGIAAMCNGCEMVRHCTEFFGNVRLEGRPLHVRLCIHRQGAPYVQALSQFLDSPQCQELKWRLKSLPSIPNTTSNDLQEPFGIWNLNQAKESVAI
jgi:cyclic pyranopterin phosphate synthase